VKIAIASPLGGKPPIDPKSDDPSSQSDFVHRFKADKEAQAALSATRRLSEVSVDDFDGLFYPGGHGPLWDLAEDASSIALIGATIAAGKPVAAVCHAPGVLRHVRTPDGGSIVQGRAVTGFSNSEEQAAGLVDVVPFLVETMLRENGAEYSKAGDWQPYVMSDGLLITGQNPASSAPAAEALLAKLVSQS
jgi:putative intracellular protease/amidase